MGGAWEVPGASGTMKQGLSGLKIEGIAEKGKEGGTSFVPHDGSLIPLMIVPVPKPKPGGRDELQVEARLSRMVASHRRIWSQPSLRYSCSGRVTPMYYQNRI
jgi:hypothetical protein